MAEDMGPLWVDDGQYRAMLIERLGIGDSLDPLLEADIPELEAAMATAGLDLPLVNRRTMACPHGYVRGEHHWYGCVGVSPFDEH